MKNSFPKSPKHLSAEAKAWWKTFVRDWDLDRAALMILESALEAFDRQRQAQEVLSREGIVVKDRWGQLKMHPCVLIERDAKGTMLRKLAALKLDLEPIQAPGRPPGSKRG